MNAITDEFKAVERWENEGGRVPRPNKLWAVRRKMKSGNNSTRRYRKFAWIFGTSALVIALLYFEQAAALYVLSTLAVCAVLLIVAFSGLEARDRDLHRDDELR